MNDNFAKMTALERELEKRFDKMCEKNNWSATAYLQIGGDAATLMLDKHSESPITIVDREKAILAIRNFIVSEFDKKDIGENGLFKTEEESIPNTASPYHVTIMAHVDAASWIRKSA